MHMLRRLRRSVLVASAGAGVAYFLDPAEGALRRQALVDRARSLADLAAANRDRTPASGGSDPAPSVPSAGSAPQVSVDEVPAPSPLDVESTGAPVSLPPGASPSVARTSSANGE